MISKSLLREEDRKKGSVRGSYWFYARMAAAMNEIRTWEKHYPLAQVKILVEGSLMVRRSPGQKAAFRDWLEKHADILPVVIGRAPRHEVVGPAYALQMDEFEEEGE